MGQSLILWEGWLWSVGILAVSAAGGLLVHRLFFAVASRLAKRTPSAIDDSLVNNSRKPAALLFPTISTLLVMPFLRLPDYLHGAASHFLGLLIIASIAWLSIALTQVLSDVIASKYDINVKDNLTARRVRTQVHVLRRIFIVVIVTITAAIMLMTFPEMRSIGTGLFASAGIAGLVIGMAARPALSNLIAGIQMALTEPIRLDDVVIIDGEWGRVEQIGTTYVVVKIWDLRRLVVPLSYFIEKPFQNWTRESADLLGTVFIYTDYSVPVGEIRGELHSILKASALWDGKVWGLQVTNATERTVELRALMSARDSGQAWDLRCEVREKLIYYLQRQYPDALPRARVEINTTKTGQVP